MQQPRSQDQTAALPFVVVRVVAQVGLTAQPLPLSRAVLAAGLAPMSAEVAVPWAPMVQPLRRAVLAATETALSVAQEVVVVEPQSRHPQTAAMGATAVPEVEEVVAEVSA